MPKINDNVQALTAELEKEIKIDTSGVGSIDEATYVKHLTASTDLTKENVESLQAFNTTFIAAGLHAFGNKSIDTIKANKDLERTTLAVPMVGKDAINYVFDKTATVPDRSEGAGEGATTTKYGQTRASLDIYGASGSRGQLKGVRDQLAADALAAFG
jgi:hypothetical protein